MMKEESTFAPWASRVRVTQERNFSAHNFLIHHAYLSLKAREETRNGAFHTELAVITMSALAIEALCNAVGSQMFDPWDDWQSPLTKLRLIASELRIAYDENREPWSTLRWLSVFRNQIAHAKPELISTSVVCGPREADARRKSMPLSKLERQVSIGNARRAYHAIYNARNLIALALDVELRFGITSDGWTGSLSIEPDAAL